jgi:hypothetical protein
LVTGVQTCALPIFIQKVGDGEALKKDCAEIADDLHQRNSYAIGFVAHTPANYAPTTIPIDLQVPAHPDYLVEAPRLIPAPTVAEAASTAKADSTRQAPR